MLQVILTTGSLSFIQLMLGTSFRSCQFRCSAADQPIVISSGSSYKKLLAFYGFDGNEDDNRGETAYINADEFQQGFVNRQWW